MTSLTQPGRPVIGMVLAGLLLVPAGLADPALAHSPAASDGASSGQLNSVGRPPGAAALATAAGAARIRATATASGHAVGAAETPAFAMRPRA
jgi:hypothetical protein